MKRSGTGLEGTFVTLVTLHSVGVGAVLLFWPAWGVRLGGWEPPESYFFVRQGGIFHLVVAMGYGLEYLQRRGTDFMVGAKTLAVVFILSATLLSEVPAAVPLAAAGDLLMLILLLALRRFGASPARDAAPLP